ncbi:MAG: DUF5305 family protein [Clostridiaceae bacterium]|nr:DUF5305 family protein [Clostridiaceae bacterium]
MKVKIKRLKMNKLLRMILIVAAVLMLCALSFLLYRETKVPKIEEKNVKLYSYTHKSSVDYKVLLKPNSLYEGSSLGEGQYYITNYVNDIQALFNYEFKGESPAGIKGYYEIAAILEGYTVVEKKHITIWEKKFVLVPRTDFVADDGIISLANDVNIKLSEYSVFADKIVEESKAQLPLQLNVYMDVNLKADADKVPEEVKMTPSITIPLDAKYFMITESDGKEVPVSIEEKQKVQLPPDEQKVRIYICALVALMIIILGLAIFTEAIRKSAFTIKLDKIFKQHGSRLVALSGDVLAASLDNCSIVRNIEDLVRIADEIGRPIMYEHSEDYKDMVHFYVLDDKRTYIYILKDSMNGSNITMNDVRYTDRFLGR